MQTPFPLAGGIGSDGETHFATVVNFVAMSDLLDLLLASGPFYDRFPSAFRNTGSVCVRCFDEGNNNMNLVKLCRYQDFDHPVSKLMTHVLVSLVSF